MIMINATFLYGVFLVGLFKKLKFNFYKMNNIQIFSRNITLINPFITSK